MSEKNEQNMKEKILNIIFETREANYCVITQEKNKKLEKILEKNSTYKMLLEKIEKLSSNPKDKEEIKGSLDSYIDRVNVIGTYENAKFYKLGFSDAVNLILECIKIK